MEIKTEIVEGAENIKEFRSYRCEIVNIIIQPDNSPEGEDVMVFQLKVSDESSTD